MQRRTRIRFFFVSICVLAAVFVIGVLGLPPLGHYRGPYGDMVNALSVPERHVTDAVTLVNFDVRGFDTLGEEYILFTSVMAVVLLLRIQREPHEGHEDRAPGRHGTDPSDVGRVVSLMLVGVIVTFGIYVVTHGQLTPGGGFQGGVILATAPLLMYMAGEFDRFKKAVPRPLVHAAEAVGACGYGLIGLGCIAAGGAFLQNVLPFGSVGSIISGGTIPLIDISVGLEVSGGLALVLVVYLEETLERKEE